MARFEGGRPLPFSYAKGLIGHFTNFTFSTRESSKSFRNSISIQHAVARATWLQFFLLRRPRFTFRRDATYRLILIIAPRRRDASNRLPHRCRGKSNRDRSRIDRWLCIAVASSSIRHSLGHRSTLFCIFNYPSNRRRSIVLDEKLSSVNEVLEFHSNSKYLESLENLNQDSQSFQEFQESKLEADQKDKTFLLYNM